MIREALEQEINGHQLYHARREEYATDDSIPFRLADEPLKLSKQEFEELGSLCQEVANYVGAVDRLYHDDETVRELLDRGKPEFFQENRHTKYLFLRPDLIITESGFKICEIETSPFGLGLAYALNEAYQATDHSTIVDGELSDHLTNELPSDGVIVDSDKTKAYRGQLEYLAERVFSGDERKWHVQTATEIEEEKAKPESIYRAFYLKEHDTDPAVQALLERGETNGARWLPSLTPHLEEKAIMALIWDSRLQDYFEQELGQASCDFLREVIPKTFIVGEEGHFSPGMPGNAANTEGIADLSRSKRSLVLKSSGYDISGSWAEGVVLLHQLSREKAAQFLGKAVAKSDGLQIVQEFHRGKKIPITVSERGEREVSEVRVRLTPYVDPETGRILAAKATGRSGTDFIHASSDSINTAVGI